LLFGFPDAHANNYSLVYKGDQIHLSRLYDVNNAAAFREHYKEQRPRLAMFVGGERDPSVLTAENWTIFAKEIGVTSDLVHAEIKNLARTMIEKIALVRERARGTVADTRLYDLVVEDVTSRCRHILNWYS
jgi:serine/threonine-protein kinase HipA